MPCILRAICEGIYSILKLEIEEKWWRVTYWLPNIHNEEEAYRELNDTEEERRMQREKRNGRLSVQKY